MLYEEFEFVCDDQGLKLLQQKQQSVETPLKEWFNFLIALISLSIQEAKTAVPCCIFHPSFVTCLDHLSSLNTNYEVFRAPRPTPLA